jgi:hypothetical protein
MIMIMTNEKFNEQINQFLSAGNGPAGVATYQISIVRPYQAPAILQFARAGNTTAIAHLNVIESFLHHREDNEPALCGTCDNTVDGDGNALLVILPGMPGSEPSAGTACVSPICPNCATLDDAILMAKAETYLKKLWPDGHMAGAAEISGGSGTA